MEIGDTNSVTQFIGDYMDLNLVSKYGNSPFHNELEESSLPHHLW